MNGLHVFFSNPSFVSQWKNSKFHHTNFVRPPYAFIRPPAGLPPPSPIHNNTSQHPSLPVRPLPRLCGHVSTYLPFAGTVTVPSSFPLRSLTRTVPPKARRSSRRENEGGRARVVIVGLRLRRQTLPPPYPPMLPRRLSSILHPTSPPVVCSHAAMPASSTDQLVACAGHTRGRASFSSPATASIAPPRSGPTPGRGPAFGFATAR